MEVCIGSPNHEHVIIRLLGGGGPDSEGWLSSEIDVAAGVWAGRFPAALRAIDFHEFLAQLRKLHRDLKGKARFETLEDQLRLTLTGDDLGHVDLAGVAIDHSSLRNELRFQLAFDQSYLPNIMQQLEEIAATFPAEDVP